MVRRLVVFLLTMFCLIPVSAAKEEAAPLRANFKRVALDFSSTSVKNARDYQNSPNAQLSADGETVVKGVFDFVLEYERPDYQWNNSLFMEYGKTKVRPSVGQSTTSENADRILLTSDYAKKSFRWHSADIGPFASLGYQTEFEKNEDPRQSRL